jgi:hypothetical protein
MNLLNGNIPAMAAHNTAGELLIYTVSGLVISLKSALP